MRGDKKNYFQRAVRVRFTPLQKIFENKNKDNDDKLRNLRTLEARFSEKKEKKSRVQRFKFFGAGLNPLNQFR